MAIDYGKMTQEEFDRILETKVRLMSAGEILSYGDVYATLAEALNNEILDTWAKEQGFEDES